MLSEYDPEAKPRGGMFPPYPAGDILSEGQIPYAFAWRKIRDSGARVCFSTDWPVVPVDTMMTVAGAVYGAELPAPWTDNRQTLLETLASYTRDNAWLEFNEHRKGALKTGYMGDVTVLDRNLFETPSELISEARISATVCGGAVTYRS